MIIRSLRMTKYDEKTVRRTGFCSNRCPICTRARKKEKGGLYMLVKMERKVCPYCRSYEKVYNRPAYE